ncbi:MAG: molybdenum ABC transporter ATP-binding protein [Nitrospira sp.]|jgi:molybdate transport system ATP-binding protein|nr:molybdenum ABC transporter ATP-binding protein [Nitrospira sp. BO4]
MSRLLARFDVRFPAFHLDVDVDVPMSGITAIFGPSGSGKTTLLRCLAGLERAPNGVMRFGDDVWQDETKDLCLPLHKRPVGYVFQEPRLFPHYNVRANLLYGYKRISSEERRITIEQVVDILGIGHLLERRIHKLSGGEQQRVAIGRALLTSPKLLLLDEPLASLDIQRKQELLPFIRRLHEELRIPVMYVSHAIAEILQLADRVVLLKEGKVIASGALNEVFTSLQFRGHFGAHRIGAILEARVAVHEAQYGLTQLEFNGQRLFVPLQSVTVGQVVRVHILSSDVSLVLEKTIAPTSVLNILEATIVEIREMDQASVDVLLDIGVPLVASITRKSLVTLGLKPRQRVFAHIKTVALNEELMA